MGLMCAKLRCLRRCCCRCCCCKDAPPLTAAARFKVLLLGATGSGKTQLGHLLTEQQRDVDDRGATNGVRCYRLPDGRGLGMGMGVGEASGSGSGSGLTLTEVGGSADMQRIWPHYYAGCHALIFCFELSASFDQLQASFALLQRCLQHAALRGKPVLLVATNDSDDDDGVQLYDVENAFRLEQLTRDFNCPLHACHMQRDQLSRGIAWLRRQLEERAPALAQRIKYDVNMQSWQRRKRALLSSAKLAQVHRQRFRRQHRKVSAKVNSTIESTKRDVTSQFQLFKYRWEIY